MKNLLITLAISSMSFFSSNAQNHHFNGSVFELRIWNNSQFTVEMENRRYDVYRNDFMIDDLQPGRYSLKVFQRYNNTSRVNVIYDGFIDIQRDSRIVAVINKYNRLDIRSVVPLYNSYNDNNNNYHRNYLPELNVPQLRNTIINTPFDNDKRLIAEQAFASNSYTAEQVLRILELFSFESTKLKLAKFAYDNCINKESYYVVNSAFAFSSSTRELTNYISGYRAPQYNNDWRNSYNRNNYYHYNENKNYHYNDNNNYHNNNNYNNNYNDNNNNQNTDNSTNIHR